MRFSDLENWILKKIKKKSETLPGSSKPQRFWSNARILNIKIYLKNKKQSLSDYCSSHYFGKERSESLLPNKPPKEQYDFAISFMKIGDYETAEFALKEFIDKNKDHDLAG